MTTDPSGRHLYRQYLKRLLDVVLAAVGMLLLAPLLLLASVAIWACLGRPVLFRQSRPGLHGDLFELVKFRTMNDDRDSRGELLPESERLTRFGRWLRRTSLDELPELWNVLRGDMSLVGPRPLLAEYLLMYSAEQARRHEVRPGITGWAQIHGRNQLDWEERFGMDVWYVDHLSLALDGKILLMTGPSVISGRGVRQKGHATTKKFPGTPKRE